MSALVSDELIEAVSELHMLFPDWRIGQLFGNLLLAAGNTKEGDIWNVEDKQLLAAARRLIEQNQERKGVQSPQ